VNIDLSGEYTGSMKAPHYAGYIDEDRLEATSPFLVINLKVHRPINITETCTISLSLGAYNLLDSYQEDLDKGEDRDSGYVYGPAKPRSFYAGVEFSF
jgi:outer membrane receptor for ferrienterochelin and colicins